MRALFVRAFLLTRATLTGVQLQLSEAVSFAKRIIRVGVI